MFFFDFTVELLFVCKQVWIYDRICWKIYSEGIKRNDLLFSNFEFFFKKQLNWFETIDATSRLQWWLHPKYFNRSKHLWKLWAYIHLNRIKFIHPNREFYFFSYFRYYFAIQCWDSFYFRQRLFRLFFTVDYFFWLFLVFLMEDSFKLGIWNKFLWHGIVCQWCILFCRNDSENPRNCEADQRFRSFHWEPWVFYKILNALKLRVNFNFVCLNQDLTIGVPLP